MRKILILLIACATITGCEDLLEPANRNIMTQDNIYPEAQFAEGILLNGYTRIPGLPFDDVATDDAVSNLNSNNYLRMATGQWTASNNPTDRWQNAKAAIQYLNIIITESDKIVWFENKPLSNAMMNDRMKGEAYGLRAYYMYYLLESHAGPNAAGELLGVPIVNEPESITSDFNKPRNTFKQCMDQLYSDVEKALELLPLDFAKLVNDSDIPAKYAGTSLAEYNNVFGGAKSLGRMTGRIAEAIRARAALLAASPAYDPSGTKWAEAAGYAATVLNHNGGIGGLDPDGYWWYNNQSQINNLGQGINPKEILWRGNIDNSRSLEEDNYPPTLYGRGRINPTQNLVDAFPMANGYPINHPDAQYNQNDPYAKRDPRLARYIVYNGSTSGPQNVVINTAADSPNINGLNKERESSTRTGYYLKKLLRQDTNVNPSGPSTTKHYTVRFRYTEMFLIYAEAANEAWGPDGKNGNDYSARDVIKAIRKRAGLGVSGNDPYLESITTQDAMRQLIRNERRLELCFEGFRFHDLRRWKESIVEPAMGISITGTDYSRIIEVEKRAYRDYMYYGPIPYTETIKFSALEQNKGW